MPEHVALGTLAFGNSSPMARDTIFRIASLTKLVSAVASMIPAEGGKVRIQSIAVT